MLTIQIKDLLDISKHTDIYQSKIKVNTPNGLKKVYAVSITAYDSESLCIKTKKNELVCSPDHKIKSNGNWIKSKDIKIDDDIDTKYGIYKISEIKKNENKYDLLDIHVDGSEYYTNDIVSHNSSLLDSFDFTLYGKVRGKKKKWSTSATLVNRINGELLNSIKFISEGVEVEIKRGISPSKLELWENGVLNTRAGKSNIEGVIEKYVGMDIETFKSFISMSINDFKNFISLTTEEKKLLLDKLFNLEVINLLNVILKEINKDNKSRMLTLDTEINTLEGSISSINRSIEKAIEKEKLNTQIEIDELTELMSSKKEEYAQLKIKVEKIKEKEKQLNDELDIEKRQLINTINDINNVDKEIKLYDLGKCPTCATDFDSEYFTNLRSLLIEKKEGFNKIAQTIRDNTNSIRAKQTKLNGISDETSKIFNDLNYLLRSYKSKIDELSYKQKEVGKEQVGNISEFEETIKELSDRKHNSHEKVTICKEKELYYRELNRILSEDGVKKSIISGIIKPINHFIKENLKKMGLIFDVRLDETFTAEIKSLGTIIEHDSLSTGETKLVNICILVAYLKLIRTKKNINVLFLDEVFSSIDVNNIDSILTLLKSFANEYKINIFVVHHAILSQEMFDRIIHIEKNIFSEIKEVSMEDTI